MNILLAEDDEKLGKLLTHLLKKEVHHVDWVKNGKDAENFAYSSTYDILILDWMLPGKDGITVCRNLRKSDIKSGILFVTAKDAKREIIEGLDAGADDYIVKPFEFDELLARIRAISRRKEKLFEDVIEIQGYRLNLTSHEFTREQSLIELTRKEYQLLEILFRNQNQVMTREILYERIWGFDSDVSDNALDALVKLVRKKIDVTGHSSIIQNVRGVGYRVRNNDVS